MNFDGFNDAMNDAFQPVATLNSLHKKTKIL